VRNGFHRGAEGIAQADDDGRPDESTHHVEEREAKVGDVAGSDNDRPRDAQTVQEAVGENEWRVVAVEQFTHARRTPGDGRHPFDQRSALPASQQKRDLVPHGRTHHGNGNHQAPIQQATMSREARCQQDGFSFEQCPQEHREVAVRCDQCAQDSSCDWMR